MSRERLSVIVGDPANNGPSSYTRFILPFSYSPVMLNEKDGNHFFYKALENIKKDERGQTDQNDEEWLNIKRRIRYMTEETSIALWKRAKWMRLWKEDKVWDGTDFEITICHGEKEIKIVTVHLSSPMLVLFESSTLFNKEEHARYERKKKVAKDDADLLLTGFLVAELHFPKKRDEVTFDDMLAVNEIFRYWQPAYSGHEQKLQKRLKDCPLNEGRKKTRSPFFKRRL